MFMKTNAPLSMNAVEDLIYFGVVENSEKIHSKSNYIINREIEFFTAAT